MTTDSTPPRLWWDGSDFLYLVADEALASHRDRVPGFYRARTVEGIPDDAVELRPVAPTLSEWAQDMRSMLGRWVEITVQREPKVTQQGVLHDFSDDGEVQLRDDTGAFHWCWPNLACLKAERPTAPSPAVPDAADFAEPEIGSIVLDANGLAWQRADAGYWRTHKGHSYGWRYMTKTYGPVRVVHAARSLPTDTEETP